MTEAREDHEPPGSGVKSVDLARMAFVAVAAVVVWFRLWEPAGRDDLL